MFRGSWFATAARVSLLSVLAGPLIADQPTPPAGAIVLARDGRTLAAPARVTDPTIRIFVSGARSGPPDCTSARPEAGSLVVRYRFSGTVTQPEILGLDDAVATDLKDGTFEIPNPAGASGLLTFNLWEGSAESSDLDRLKICMVEARKAADALAESKRLADLADAAVEASESATQKTQKRIAELEADAKALGAIPTDRSLEQVLMVLAEARKLRDQLSREEDQAELAKGAAKKAQRDLAQAESKNGGRLAAVKARADRLSDYVAAKEPNAAYSESIVLKTGGVLVGSQTLAVNYDLSARAAEDVITISPMGPYPTVRYGEDLAVALLNVVQARYPSPLSMQVTAQAGVVINIAPSRPVFEPGKLKAPESASARESKVTPADPLFSDLFLPVVGTFGPNDLAEVTLTTERADKDGKRTEVKLLDKARLPTFRARYRFNFNSGVVSTALRKHTFQKVKTVDDDPATQASEARYRVDDLLGEKRALPMFAFTVYPVPVDIQSPVTWQERLIPNPTVGFAFTNPGDDVFLGFSHELVRNLQVFWGWHFGKVTEAVQRNDVTEDRDATAPATRDKRERAFAWGVSLNLNVVKNIFK